jgi:L-asparaginase type II
MRLASLIAAASLTLSPAALAGQEKPRVHILATGGTISNLGGNARRTGAELIAAIPGLSNVAQVTVEQFSNIASGAITHEQWRALAGRIAALMREPNAPAGVVITHGTDTMEETAYFLDLTAPTCAPIVLTGAMRQAEAVGADGPANLLNAVRVAVAPTARNQGALILMNDEIFRARDVTKINTSRMDAFTAPNAGPVGVADPDSVVFLRAPTRRSCGPVFDLTALGALPRVDVIYTHIGADSVLVDAAVAAGARAIVVAGVGRGGMPPALGRAARRAIERGVIVVVSSRTGGGRVGQVFNADSQNVARRGAMIAAQELNPQKARVLVMLGIAAQYDAARLASLFRTM